MLKKILCVCLIVLIFINLVPMSLSAKEADYSDFKYAAKNLPSAERLFDSNRSTYITVGDETSLVVSREDGIENLYIEFDRVPEEWTLVAGKKEYVCGKQGFLHEYINVSELCGAQKELTLKFKSGTVLADIYVFGGGELPSFVQDWSKPCDTADILLLSSHSDDEQLFFAGLLPYYAIERKCRVQVVYMVQHFEVNGTKEHKRPHEQLDGLWTVGIRNYPVMSDFPDVYSESKDHDKAFAQAGKAFGAVGVTYDDFKGYVTECLRRFKPLVVVSHDLKGEYGHGTHVFTASALTEAINLAADETQYPDSAQKYGVWKPLKTYIHLYNKNKITMDWDTPYESLNGKTPFQVSQQGFDCHKSQHWTWFNFWIYGANKEITKASEIRSYSPCQYGLYDTSVGADTVGGDFMENVKPYAEREKEALEAEKQNTQESELIDLYSEPEKKPTNIKAIVCCSVIVVLIIVVIIMLSSTKKRNKRYR